MILEAGLSPFQRQLGFTPRGPGGLLAGASGSLVEASKLVAGDVGVIKRWRLQEAAGKAFFEADCREKLARAVLSGPRAPYQPAVGDVCYFWKRGDGVKKGKHA